MSLLYGPPPECRHLCTGHWVIERQRLTLVDCGPGPEGKARADEVVALRDLFDACRAVLEDWRADMAAVSDEGAAAGTGLSAGTVRKVREAIARADRAKAMTENQVDGMLTETPPAAGPGAESPARRWRPVATDPPAPGRRVECFARGWSNVAHGYIHPFRGDWVTWPGAERTETTPEQWRELPAPPASPGGDMTLDDLLPASDIIERAQRAGKPQYIAHVAGVALDSLHQMGTDRARRAAQDITDLAFSVERTWGKSLAREAE